MRNMFNKAFIAAAVAVSFGGLAATPAHAQLGSGVVFCTNCSNQISQATQTAKQIETALNTAKQLQNQISQYQEMLKQGVSLPGQVFNRMTGSLQKLQQVVDQGKALAGTASNFDQQFRSQFKSFDSYLASSGSRAPSAATYKRWNEQGMDSMRVAMQSAGMNVNEIADEDAMLSQIIARSQNASGRMQAIQAGNEISAQQVQQLMKLRQMMNAQIQSQSTFYSQQMERQAADDAFRQSFRGTVKRGGSKEY